MTAIGGTRSAVSNATNVHVSVTQAAQQWCNTAPPQQVDITVQLGQCCDGFQQTPQRPNPKPPAACALPPPPPPEKQAADLVQAPDFAQEEGMRAVRTAGGYNIRTLKDGSIEVYSPEKNDLVMRIDKKGKVSTFDSDGQVRAKNLKAGGIIELPDGTALRPTFGPRRQNYAQGGGPGGDPTFRLPGGSPTITGLEVFSGTACASFTGLGSSTPDLALKYGVVDDHIRMRQQVSQDKVLRLGGSLSELTLTPGSSTQRASEASGLGSLSTGTNSLLLNDIIRQLANLSDAQLPSFNGQTLDRINNPDLKRFADYLLDQDTLAKQISAGRI